MTAEINPNDLAASMPEYICHKRVNAEKITGVAPIDEDRLTVQIFLGEKYVKLPTETFSRHWPSVGDYLVVYEDGYVSVSPPGVFEAGYEKIHPPGKFYSGSTNLQPDEDFSYPLAGPASFEKLNNAAPRPSTSPPLEKGG